MAINLELTYSFRNLDYPVVVGEQVKEEGLVLVRSFDPISGAECVKCSTGQSTDIFVGFSFKNNLVPGENTIAQEWVIPLSVAPATTVVFESDLSNIVPGQVRIVAADGTTMNKVANAAGVDAAGKYYVDEKHGKFTFHADNAGASITVFLRYEMTYSESVRRNFQPGPNMTGPDSFGKVAAIVGSESRVYTDRYDVTADWATAEPGMGADGVVCPATGNVQPIPGARVIALPSPSSPWLGIRY